MECPNCKSQFARRALKVVRKGQHGVEAQCPKCDTWLMFEPKMMLVKNIGMLMLLVFSVTNFFLENSDYRLMCSFAAFAGACIALFGVFKGKMIVADTTDNKDLT
ncbi:zinc-ribbon domain-containing protein [Shewanella phaeophyticola]|uniref:Zinc-ribbon domain-containing protein n=1 Tax=Shewanella phaeophyticola TaxID=2978345 RepID=A0ABT2P205_9GAMM|nr:zinc-ribbon domain-containing protein [Shewanella sp. KJ10-1]MCT8986685.1 zinc-ribbon domain-containing protein [Shewanella sp. KJ10-1]